MAPTARPVPLQDFFEDRVPESRAIAHFLREIAVERAWIDQPRARTTTTRTSSGRARPTPTARRARGVLVAARRARELVRGLSQERTQRRAHRSWRAVVHLRRFEHALASRLTRTHRLVATANE